MTPITKGNASDHIQDIAQKIINSSKVKDFIFQNTELKQANLSKDFLEIDLQKFSF